MRNIEKKYFLFMKIDSRGDANWGWYKTNTRKDYSVK